MTPSSKVRLFWIVTGAILTLMIVALRVAPRLVATSTNRTLDANADPASDEAERLRGMVPIADLHSDALLWGRDLTRPGTYGHVDVPRLVEGRVALQVFSAVIKTPWGLNVESNTGDSDQIMLLAIGEMWPVRAWGSLLARAIYQADRLYRTAAGSRGRLAVVRSREELATFLRARDPAEATVAGVLSVEGAQALMGDASNVDRLFDAGYRMMGLTHFYDNEVGGSAHGVDKGGLTDFGAEVMARMERIGMAVDLAHASPALIDDVLDVATRPVLISHTGVKGTCDNIRNVDDARLERIAASGGVIGIGLWPEAICGETPADWARAVRYAVDLVGVRHVAMGSDWDGAVATVVDPKGTDLLIDALLAQGFDTDAIGAIMGGNAIRYLLEILPSEPRPGRGASASR